MDLMRYPLLLLPCLLTSSTVLSRGQHGGERALLVVDPTNETALHVANHYAALRDVPPAAVLHMDPDAPDYAALAAGPLRGMLGELAQRGLSDSLDFVVLAPSDQFFVSASGLLADGCSPVNRIALPSAYGLYEYEPLLLGPGTPSVLQSNGYAGLDWLAQGFRGELRWFAGAPSTNANARRSLIPTALGWTGERGNTKAEVLAMIDRSVAADGTFPAGTAYYMQTTDPARSGPRHSLYPNAVAQMALAGGAGSHLMDVLPLGRHDALGVMTGWASPDVDGGNFTLLAGAFCDHLTSYAATFDVGSQVKMSRWITKGASGTAGTVEEPCNYASKFPHPRVHVVYRRGLTLGEAWLRSMAAAPFQELFLGDPLTSPFALEPTLQVNGWPAGAGSGQVPLKVTATPHPQGGAAIAEIELFVDGMRVARGPLAGGLLLDSADMADGWHDVRVRVTDDAAGRNTGVVQRWVQVDNGGTSVSCTAAPATGDLSTRFGFTLDAQGGDVDEVVVLQGTRIVACLVGSSGTVHVHGRNMGAGPVRLVAEARFADGRRARSAELALDVQDTAAAPSAMAPVAFGYRRVLATPDAFVLDLPASFDVPLQSATTVLVDPPGQATVLGGQGSVRTMAPTSGARGVDLLRFEVSTAAGTSERAILQLVYAAGSSEARLACVSAPNSAGPGTRIGWSGSTSVAANDLVLKFAGAPTSSFGLVFLGTSLGRSPSGNGFLCVGSGHARLGVVQADPVGAASLALDLSSPPSPAAAVLPGDTRVFQLWHRDSFGAGFGFSDALVATFLP
jgi:hypothetical protein